MNIRKVVIKTIVVDLLPSVLTNVVDLFNKWEYMLGFLILSLIVAILWEYTAIGKKIDEKISDLNPFIDIPLSQAAKILRTKINIRDEDDFFMSAFKDAPNGYDYRVGIFVRHLIEIIQKGYLKLYGDKWPQHIKEEVPLDVIRNEYFDRDKTILFKDIDQQIVNYSNLRVNKYKLLKFINDQKKLPGSKRY